ncbi:MAG TPA: ATP-binding protein [Solirubrobacteraceae bacterium]|jgi:ATP-dependent DNA helicase RecG
MSYPPLHPASPEQPSSFASVEDFEQNYVGETSHVEFKTGTGNRPLQDSIVAFSNADGGVIFVGVSDDGEPVGRELTPGTFDAIVQAFRDTHDPGRYSIRQILVGETPIVAIAVAKRVSGFAQTSNGRVLARRGSQKVALFGDELRRLLIERSPERFDGHDSCVLLSAISGDRLDELRQIYTWQESNIEDRLRERGLLMADVPNLTMAGAMYLVDDPSPMFGKAYIEILRYPLGSSEYDRRTEIRGPLHLQVAEATAAVSDELGHELVVVGLHRHELPKLPTVVLREALANAVAHRSYEMTGVAIRVEIHPDEVRIISPGGLPEPVTEENIRVAQSARNGRIIGVLRQAGLAEDAGRGINVMLDSMRSELLDPPRFKDLGRGVEVSLPTRGTVTAVERAWVREVEARGMIQPLDRLILVHAARGERITNAHVRDLLHIDSADARQALRRLRDADLLVQEGQRGGATYRVSDSISAPAGLRLSQTELTALLLDMAREGPITNAKVRARTGLDRAEALRALEQLFRSGKLIRIGTRRGTRYQLPPAHPG